MFKKKTSPGQEGRSRQPARNVGPQGAGVFSYHAKRSVRPNATGRSEQPLVTAASNKRRNTQRKWFKRVPVIIGAIMLLIYVGLNLPVSDNPKIMPAKEARGGIFLRPSSAYLEATRKLLAGSIFNSNKLTINTERLERDLRTQFPELADVALSMPLIGTRPAVHLEPATPALILTTASTEVYVLDNTGRALITAAQVPGLDKLGLPVVKDESGLSIKLGETVLPSSNIAFITEVVGQLKAKQIAIEALTLPGGTSQLDMKVKGVPYLVKFNLMGNARVEVGAYVAVRQHLERQRKVPANYIDVRVDDRAYYR